jgi:alkylation response protein AidB-like acyl-CoA dehydrogenase
MLVTLTPEQELFRETTGRFLEEREPTSALRRWRDHPDGFDRGYWRAGAELGWTSMLVDEAHGGGTVSGAGLVDLSLVAYEFGQHAAPGPLNPTNVVAAFLAEHDARPDVLSDLLSGTAVAAWCGPMVETGVLGWRPTVALRREGAALVLEGTVEVVEYAAQADHLLVTAQEGAGATQVLVPPATAGLTVTPLRSVDLTRRFARVTCRGVRVGSETVVGEPEGAGPDVTRQFRRALAVLNAEAVGALQAGFDMTVEWAFNRYSFGRPLASYQALKHRFADMLTWLEASHAVSDAACQAAGEGRADADELASAAKAYVGQYGGDLLQDCVQIHGGIGVTYEHDLHLFLRRFTVNRMSAGTPGEHRRRVAALYRAAESGAA